MAQKTYLHIIKKDDSKLYRVVVSTFENPALGGQVLESGLTKSEATALANDLSKRWDAKLIMADGGMAGGIDYSKFEDEEKTHLDASDYRRIHEKVEKEDLEKHRKLGTHKKFTDWWYDGGREIAIKKYGDDEQIAWSESYEDFKDEMSSPKVIHTQFEEDEFEYADGGMMAKGGRTGRTSKIKDWYTKKYPTDDLGEEINDSLTFKGLWGMMSQGYDVYEVLGVGDSLVRERVFEKLSEILGVDYGVVYDEWLDGGKKRRMNLYMNRDEYADGGMMSDGGMMARGGYTSKGELVWRKLSNSEKMDFLYKNFTPEITPRSQEILVGKSYNFLPKNVKNVLERKYANVEDYADGGMMAHGGKTHRSRHRKKTLEEKAMEAVGSDTWFQLDKETQAGVIAEMLSMGELPQRMAKGAKVAEKKDFVVEYELMDGKKVIEKYDSEELMDDGIANFYIMNDVKDAIVGGKPEIVEEVKEVVTEAKPKRKSLFDVEKATPKVAKSKQTNPIAHIDGIEKEIQKYDELKAIIKNAEAEKEIIGGIIKDVAKDYYLDIYEKQGKRPTTITIESGGVEITYTIMDKYKTVTPEKETVLKEYDNLLGTDYTFTFDNEILDTEGKNGEKIADIINELIENSEDIPDDLKSKVVKITKKVGVKKGSIERLLAYDNPSEILQVIEPVEMLK